MTNQLGAILAFVFAALCTLVLTPMLGRLGRRLGAVDHPDGRRKSHLQPIPRTGGLAVVAASAVAVVFGFWFLAASAEMPSWVLRGLIPAVLVLLVVGMVDDLLTLTGIYKLIGQVLAVSALVAGGAKFEVISLFSATVPLGDLCIPFSIFFCLGAINAFNLIDGADGLASSVGAIVCITLGMITLAQGDVVASLICFAAAGALVGFLRYNLPPASVYLGDTGSMLIGLIVAAVAIDSSIKQQTAFALLVPIAICAIPILDAAAAMVRRVTTGQSVFTADRGHLHHALLLRGWTVGQTVAFISGLTAITCAGALASYFTNHDFFALAASAGVFAALAGTKIFGHAEMALIRSHSRSLARRLFKRRGVQSAPGNESSVRLQGNRQWQVLWAALCEAAPVHNMTGLTLQVNIPQLHESFYANWRCSDAAPALSEVWRVTLPLMLRDQSIGRLSVVGASGGRQAVMELQQLMDLLEPLEAEIAQVVSDVAGDSQRTRADQPAPAGALEGVGPTKHASLVPFVPTAREPLSVSD